MDVKAGKPSILAGIKGLQAAKQKPSLVPTQAIPLLAPAKNAITITNKNRDEILLENAKKEEKLPLLRISKSVISLYSYEEMQRIGPIRITNQSFEGNNSVNDPRMGVVSLAMPCQYCSKIDCPGHYGLIDFKNTPIYNPAFIRKVVSVLSCVCNSCSGLLMSEDLIEHNGIFKMGIEKRLESIESLAKGRGCLNNKQPTGGGEITSCRKNPTYVTKEVEKKGTIVYKIGGDTKEHPMDIEGVNTILNHISVRDCYTMGFLTYHRQFSTADILRHLDKVSPQILEMYNLSGHRSRPFEEVLCTLDSLTELVLKEQLNFPTGNHPRNMILRGVLVPPVIARPPVSGAGSMYHDQLTHIYIAIVKEAEAAGKGLVTELYETVRQMIFNPDKKKMGMRDYMSVVERFQGKYALLRGLLMGKRNDYCGRTVAGPDTTLRFGEISVPDSWASSLLKHIKVTHFNIQELRRLLKKGEITYITPAGTNLKRFYDPKSNYQLKVGDTVDRWLQDGDRLVVNRQPTLHRQSMMGYTARRVKRKTIGSHLSYTSPMNCDYDGDENNAWSPRDFEVEAETEVLLNVKNNIMSSEQNRPIMGMVMNSITGSYLLTDDRTFVRDNLFRELMNMISHKEPLRTLYSRLSKYGVHPRSGKAVFSALLPEDFFYEHKGVLILEGVLVSGRLRKAHVGASHRSIIQELYKRYGPERTSIFFTDCPWVINKWIMERGFSVGILDMINLEIDPVTGEEYDKNKRVLEKELAKVYVKLEALGDKLDDPIEEMYRQNKIKNLVNTAEGVGKKLASEVLSGDNSIGIMTDKGAGTKGAVANIGQMMGSVGQQYYRGERLKATLTGGRRLLPAFDLDDMNPEAHAFIPQSFYEGISPEGLFFLQAGGREGVLDTSLKTSESGAIQHKMIKALENVVIGYDGSIRNTIGTLFAPMYNAGYDIGEMIAVDTAGLPDLSSFVDVKALVSELNVKRGWIPEKVQKNIKPFETEETILDITEEYVNTPGPVTVALPSGPMKITKYEKARILGARAIQLSNNAVPLVDTEGETDFVKIALKEFASGKLDIYVVRKFADGSFEKVYPTLENILM